MQHPNPLLQTAIQAAIAAGNDIMQIYTDPEADFGIERKADNSPLTRADKAAHARIMSFLEPTGIPVLSEEGAHLPYEERRHWRRLWIVDPLDGTKEFIKRNGEFTVNIALVEHGTPVLGVIYVPATAVLYYGRTLPPPSLVGREQNVSDSASAEPSSAASAPSSAPSDTDLSAASSPSSASSAPDSSAASAPSSASSAPDLSGIISSLPLSSIGAWRVQLPSASCPQTTPLPTREGQGGGSFLVVASRSHLSPETADFIENLRREHPDLQLVSSGSSLKICLVAEGKADIYPRHAPTMEWDTAAGHAIALAAGREMVDANTGQPLTYNKLDLHNPWFIVR